MSSCIVYYETNNQKHDPPSSLSQNACDRILEAKAIWEELGGDNFHREQCVNIPDDLDPAVHVAHLNPCHKNFTLIISTYKNNKRRKSLEDADTPRINRSKTQSTARDLFPGVCYFCKKKRKKG